MIKAVLLDLDNTLLNNSDNVFVGEYLRLVDDYFLQRWNIADFSQALRTIIRTTAGPRDMQETNGQLAQQILADASGKSNEEMNAAFADFYAEVYPRLRNCVQAVPAAPELVEYLRSQDLAVAIATNPLYPAEAIRQRLAWAGLPDDLETYAIVTHLDNMHFAKPDPAYYAEIVARIGVEPDEAVMVGDSLSNDMQPAEQIGMNTFTVLHGSNDSSDTSGSLQDFAHRVQHEHWLENLTPQPLRPESIDPELRGNVGALFGLLADVKPHHWHQHPDPNEWSIMQIVCHLLASERQVQRPRLQRILAEDNPFLVQPQPPPGPREASPCDESGWKAAQRFAAQRGETMDWLRRLGSDDWMRPARHSIFGLTTLLEMAHFTAQHDRLHINQLCQTLGRCE